jgi:hypothetical protein
MNQIRKGKEVGIQTGFERIMYEDFMKLTALVTEFQ